MAGEIEVPEGLISYPVKDHLVYEAVVNHLANKRRGTASTKTRSFVNGGGKKPWRQKGTGRASGREALELTSLAQGRYDRFWSRNRSDYSYSTAQEGPPATPCKPGPDQEAGRWPDPRPGSSLRIKEPKTREDKGRGCLAQGPFNLDFGRWSSTSQGEQEPCSSAVRNIPGIKAVDADISCACWM